MLQEKMNKGPHEFRVSVLMECSERTDHPWLDESWQLSGVVAAGVSKSSQSVEPTVTALTHSTQYLWNGLPLRLHRDECESYYHNLMAEIPALYVVTLVDDNERPEPFIVTASFDEAHAYLEGEGDVLNGTMSPEIYRWIEGFVLENYIPVKKKKRKLDNWKESAR